MFGSRETHDKVENVLRSLDVPTPAWSRKRRSRYSRWCMQSRGQAAHLLATLLPKNAHVALAVDERTRSLVASGSRDALAIAEAVLTRLDVEASRERPKPSASYEVRILWLANDGHGDRAGRRPERRHRRTVAAGIKDVRQIGQMAVRDQPRAVRSTSAVFPALCDHDHAANLPLRGSSRNRATGRVTYADCRSRPAGGCSRSRVLSEISTTIVLPQKQYVVLATASGQEH